MLVVFPVHAKNAPLFEQLAKLFEKIGANANHDVVVLACPSVLEKGQEFGERVSRLFRSVEVTVARHQVNDLIRGRNQMFQQAAEIAATKGQPWIWMEDAYPTRKKWLDTIEGEYKQNTALPFLGCIEQAFEKARDPEGNFIEGQYANKGQFMRFGVYPADFNSTSTLIRFLDGYPFEHYLRGEVVNQARQSQTMATVWASVDFERNSSDLIEGQQSPAYETALRRNEKRTANDRDVAIIHGCRDGSLGFVLLRKTFLSPDELATQKQQREIEERQEEISRMSEELKEAVESRDELKKEIARITELNDELQSKVREFEERPDVPAGNIEDLEGKLAKKEEVLTKYKGTIQDLESEVKVLKKERTTLRSKVTKLENQLETA